ncbi:MAG: DUF3131 domain-containing protein, partial [Elusimicrobia bacterium]|nr:DUF3131 domain-containing protein [Elusimicrobiota bacterium]
MNCFKSVKIFLSVFFSFSLLSASEPISKKDRAYLVQIYADTWNCIQHFVDEKTGLPYDSNQWNNSSTSITNIGFYFASCAAAFRTGLIPEEDAKSRIQRALESLSKIEKWRGFPVTWVNLHTLETADKQFSTADHLGNLCASLILVKNIFPELEEKVNSILAPMNWGVLYEPSNHFYKGGYLIEKQDFDLEKPWGKWYYNFLGADTRMGSFLGVSKGEVPIDHWKALNRGMEEKYGQKYYVPGWQGGGLFMQFIAGLFLDERKTVIGKSAGDFAYAQILHAQKVKSPVWGWSAATAPNGEYLGWGLIKDAVVTPHASALAIIYYPAKTISNLKRLEKLGARALSVDRGKQYAFGFRDSIDLETNRVSSVYLILDQTMLFLS